MHNPENDPICKPKPPKTPQYKIQIHIQTNTQIHIHIKIQIGQVWERLGTDIHIEKTQIQTNIQIQI